MLRGGTQGVQGMIANTRMYFTPVGKPEDFRSSSATSRRTTGSTGWPRREDRPIWQYPYDRPHCYLLTDSRPTSISTVRRANERYLDAVLGAWELYHDEWEHVGGSIAICEDGQLPIRRNPIACTRNPDRGTLRQRLLGQLSQRLHLLFPEEEKYVKKSKSRSINVGIANQRRRAGHPLHRPPRRA